MRGTYNAKVIVLDRQLFREKDSRVVVFSESHGMKELIVRGTKKILSKLAAHIEPITVSKIMVVPGRRYDYVGSAVSENCFRKLKLDYDKTMLAGRAVGFFKRQIRENETIDSELFFGLVSEFLEFLDRENVSREKCELFFSFFSLKLASLLGYKPELSNCVKCKKRIEKEKNSFDISSGVICSKCRTGDKNEIVISGDAIKIMRQAINESFGYLNKIKINSKLSKEVVTIISTFVKYNL